MIGFMRRRFSQSISTRINLPFALIFVFVLVSLIYVANTAKYASGQMEELNAQTKHILQLSQIRASTYSLLLSVNHALLLDDPAALQVCKKKLETLDNQVAGYIQIRDPSTDPDAKHEVSMMKEIQASLGRIRAISGGMSNDFKASGSNGSDLANRIESEVNGIQNITQLIGDLHMQRTGRLVEASKDRINFIFNLFIAFFLMGFILLLIVNIIVLRHVVWPVKKLASATADIAEGDLSRQVEGHSEDEIGILAQSFNEMARQLEEHDRKQRDFSKELERMVKERTRELEQTTDRLQATRDRLIRTEKQALVGRLASVVAHEVRTPLNSLALNVQVLQRKLQEIMDLPDGPLAESLYTIDLEVSRMNQVVEDFVSYARFPDPKIHETDINAIVQQISNFLVHEATDAGVSFQLDLQNDIPALEADEDQVRQLLINLCSNAIQAMPEGGTLTLTTDPVEDVNGMGRGVRICVTDEGVGIPAGSLDGIFEPFYSTKEKGMGLGLAIVTRIVDQHNGKIVCHSGHERGTTFEILLPTRYSDRNRSDSEMTR